MKKMLCAGFTWLIVLSCVRPAAAGACDQDSGTRAWILHPDSLAGGCLDQHYQSWMKKFDYQLNELEETTWPTSDEYPSSWEDMSAGLHYDPMNCQFWMYDHGPHKIYTVDAPSGSKYTPIQNLPPGYIGGMHYDWLRNSLWVRGMGDTVQRYTFEFGALKDPVITDLGGFSGLESEDWGAQYDMSDLRTIRVDRITGDAWVPVNNVNGGDQDLMVRIDGESGEITMILAGFENISSFDIDEKNRILWVADNFKSKPNPAEEGWIYKFELPEMPKELEDDWYFYEKTDLSSGTVHFAGQVLDIAASPFDASVWSLVWFPLPEPPVCFEGEDTYSWGNTNICKHDINADMKTALVLYDDSCEKRMLPDGDHIESDEFDGSCVVLRRIADWKNYSEWNNYFLSCDDCFYYEDYCAEHPDWFPYSYQWGIARVPADAGMNDTSLSWKKVEVPWGDGMYTSGPWNPRVVTAKIPWPVEEECSVNFTGIGTTKSQYCVLDAVQLKGAVHGDCGIEKIIIHLEGGADATIEYDGNCSTEADISHEWGDGFPEGSYSIWVEVIPCIGDTITTKGEPVNFSVVNTPPAVSIKTGGQGNQFTKGEPVQILLQANGACSGLKEVTWKVAKGNIDAPPKDSVSVPCGCSLTYAPPPIVLQDLDAGDYYCSASAVSCSGLSGGPAVCYFKVKEPVPAKISIIADQTAYVYSQTVYCTVEASAPDGIGSINYRWIQKAGFGNSSGKIGLWKSVPWFQPGQKSYMTNKIAIPGPDAAEYLFPLEHYLEAELVTVQGEEIYATSGTFKIGIPKTPQIWLKAFYYQDSFPGTKFMINAGAFAIYGLCELKLEWSGKNANGGAVTMPLCQPVTIPNVKQPYYEFNPLVFPPPGQENVTSTLASGPVTITAKARYYVNHSGLKSEISKSIQIYYGFSAVVKKYDIPPAGWKDKPAFPYGQKPPDSGRGNGR